MLNNQDIDQLHPNLIHSMDISKFRQRSRNNLEQSWPPYRYLLKSLSQLIHIPSDILNSYIYTIFCLILLGLIFPLNFLITLLTYIISKFRNFFQSKSIMINPNSKRILISGGSMTIALELSRAFYQAGHEIILIDESMNWLTGHRWSNSVERFYVYSSENYVNTLTNIVRKEKINIFIPLIPSQINTEIKSALAVHGCSVFPEINCIDNQYTFIDKARSIGLTVPQTFLITSRQQLLDFDFHTKNHLFICKNDESMIKLPRSTSIETNECINKLFINETHPYILQEFISGKKYSTYGICINGVLKLFTCNHSTSSSQINYKHIQHPKILQWCIQYIQTYQLTGHISFDFIVNNHDGKAYAIGCNSSINSSLTEFYNHPNLVDVFLSNQSSLLVNPLSTAREIYWLPNELWEIIRNIRSIKKLFQSFKRILFGKEAIWSFNDPFPFLLHYHIHILYLLIDNLFSKHIRSFSKIDFSLGKLV